MVSLLKNQTAAKPCGCADEDTAVVGTVTVFGHDEDCALATPRAYYWLADARDPHSLSAGNLAKYATHWAAANYSGDTGPTTEVKTWEGKTFTVVVESQGKDDDDYLHYRLTAGNEQLQISIDGRG